MTNLKKNIHSISQAQNISHILKFQSLEGLQYLFLQNILITTKIQSAEVFVLSRKPDFLNLALASTHRNLKSVLAQPQPDPIPRVLVCPTFFQVLGLKLQSPLLFITFISSHSINLTKKKNPLMMIYIDIYIDI